MNSPFFLFHQNTVLAFAGDPAAPDPSPSAAPPGAASPLLPPALLPLLSTPPFAAADRYTGPALPHPAFRLPTSAPRPPAPPSCLWLHPRDFAAAKSPLAPDLFSALGFMNWKADHRYCGRCAAPLAPHPTEPALACPSCGKLFYPRVSPAVIVRVTRPSDGAILLARHRQRNQDVWSCIAGFMNLGEPPEDAVRREVMEETSLTVDTLRFVDLAYWPFPNSLMFAYTARYVSGTIKIQESELLEAAFFPPDALPPTPPPGSLAHRLLHLPV